MCSRCGLAPSSTPGAVGSANGLAPVVGHRRRTHKQLNLGRGARPGVRRQGVGLFRTGKLMVQAPRRPPAATPLAASSRRPRQFVVQLTWPLAIAQLVCGAAACRPASDSAAAVDLA